jgi:hypothetical protein
MSDIAKSFASLVNNNNGLFKSEKQAAFLLSMCQEGKTFICGGHVYKNPFIMLYHCNDKGVVKVEKHTPHTGKLITTWEPKQEGALSIKEKKLLKVWDRDIKALEKAIISRQASWDSGQYDHSMIDLFNRSMKSDEGRLIDLIESKNKLIANI